MNNNNKEWNVKANLSFVTETKQESWAGYDMHPPFFWTVSEEISELEPRER